MSEEIPDNLTHEIEENPVLAAMFYYYKDIRNNHPYKKESKYINEFWMTIHAQFGKVSDELELFQKVKNEYHKFPESVKLKAVVERSVFNSCIKRVGSLDEPSRKALLVYLLSGTSVEDFTLVYLWFFWTPCPTPDKVGFNILLQGLGVLRYYEWITWGNNNNGICSETDQSLVINLRQKSVPKLLEEFPEAKSIAGKDPKEIMSVFALEVLRKEIPDLARILLNYSIVQLYDMKKDAEILSVASLDAIIKDHLNSKLSELIKYLTIQAEHLLKYPTFTVRIKEQILAELLQVSTPICDGIRDLVRNHEKKSLGAGLFGGEDVSPKSIQTQLVELLDTFKDGEVSKPQEREQQPKELDVRLDSADEIFKRAKELGIVNARKMKKQEILDAIAKKEKEIRVFEDSARPAQESKKSQHEQLSSPQQGLEVHLNSADRQAVEEQERVETLRGLVDMSQEILLETLSAVLKMPIPELGRYLPRWKHLGLVLKGDRVIVNNKEGFLKEIDAQLRATPKVIIKCPACQEMVPMNIEKWECPKCGAKWTLK